MQRAQDALAVFAKYPRVGHVKTRLQNVLSARQCFLLHRALLGDVAERCQSLDVSHHLFLADCQQDQAATLAESLHGTWQVGLQRGRDLGERMHNAFRDLAARYRRIVLLGTDSPDLPLGRLRRAFRELRRWPVVLGPSSDGGYYLLGLSRPQPQIFRDIQWGSRQVLEQTLRRLEPGEVHLLEEWYDVDREEDLQRLWRQLDPLQEGFPARTADFLLHCPQIASLPSAERRPAP